MYCRFCGKLISEDSFYCPYCGKQVNQADSSTESPSQECRSKTISNDDVSNSNSSDGGDIIKVKKESKKTNRSQRIADEIIANLKMIGFAILGWLVYMCGAYLYHYKDSKPIQELSEFMESCYDNLQELSGVFPSSWNSGSLFIEGYDDTAWLLWFEKDIRSMPPYSQWSSLDKRTMIPPSHDFWQGNFLSYDYDYQKIIELAQQKGFPETVINKSEEQAKNTAQSSKESFLWSVSATRKYEFQDYLHTQMKWAAIISLCFFILGRYIIKSVKWVAANRTKNENKNNSLISLQEQIENGSINDEGSTIENT